MKHFSILILGTFLLLLSAIQLNAQTLAFSQVLQVSAAEDTVPANKVWKVEAFWQHNTSIDSNVEPTTCTYTYRHHPFFINGNYYYKFDGSPGTGSATRYMAVGNTFPLWLPAGTRLRTVCSQDFLSIIEFTVTP